MIEQNENTIKEQNNIPGQKKEVDVKDYPYASELANMLKDIEYPTDKNKILNFIKSIGNTDKNIMELLEKIEDKQYNNSAEVINGTGLIKRQQIYPDNSFQNQKRYIFTPIGKIFELYDTQRKRDLL